MRNEPSADTADLPVLLTGALGFVGSHVVAQLTAAGSDVVAVDLGDTTPPIEDLWSKERHRITLTRADVRDDSAIRNLVELHRPRAVVHAAAVTNVEDRAGAALMHEVNVVGTEVVLRAARGTRTLLVSSASVYQPQPDDDATYGEDSPVVAHTATESSTSYAATKRAAELIAIAERRARGDVRVARVAACFGPLERPTEGRTAMSVGHRAIMATRAGRRVVADPDAVTDLSFVEDIALAIVILVETDRAHPITNVGAGVPVRLTDLARTANDAAERAGRSLSGPPERICMTAGARHGVMEVSRLRTSGFAPRFSTSRGVTTYMDWLDHHEY